MIVELPMNAAGDPAEIARPLARLQSECPTIFPHESAKAMF
jgi:hypothetical protein